MSSLGIIRGLNSRPDLNGRAGIMIELITFSDAEPARRCMQVLVSGEVVKAKCANVFVIKDQTFAGAYPVFFKESYVINGGSYNRICRGPRHKKAIHRSC